MSTSPQQRMVDVLCKRLSCTEEHAQLLLQTFGEALVSTLVWMQRHAPRAYLKVPRFGTLTLDVKQPRRCVAPNGAEAYTKGGTAARVRLAAEAKAALNDGTASREKP